MQFLCLGSAAEYAIDLPEWVHVRRVPMPEDPLCALDQEGTPPRFVCVHQTDCQWRVKVDGGMPLCQLFSPEQIICIGSSCEVRCPRVTHVCVEWFVPHIVLLASAQENDEQLPDHSVFEASQVGADRSRLKWITAC